MVVVFHLLAYFTFFNTLARNGYMTPPHKRARKHNRLLLWARNIL